MLGEKAVEDVVATGLPAFLGPDAGADDFAGFLPDYHDWEGSVGLFGAEGPDDGPFGDPSPEGAVWPDGVWPGVVGSGFRFVRGVNQASYFFGDARFRVNCLEACVAFHNSVKFGRQFVAGPAGDRDPARLEVAFGRQARPVEGVAGVERYVRGGPVGVAVPVLYQRPDGSAHVINAVRTGSKDPAGRDVVVLWDPQRGEEAEGDDVSAVTGMWVIPVPEAEAGPAGMVVLPSSGSGLRSQGWGSGLPTEVAGPKRQPGVSGLEAGKPGPGAKRTRAEAGERSRGKAGESSRGAKRQKAAAAAAGIDPGSPGNDESEVLTPTDQPVQQDEREAERKQKNRAKNAKYRQGLKAAADRVAELEALKGLGPLTEEQAAELAELQPKMAQQKQQKKEKNAKYRQGLKAAADRVAVLEALAGRGPLTEEQAAELAALQPKAAQWIQQTKKKNAKQYQARRAAADRVVVLEELAGRGPLTEEQAAELGELQPKMAQRKQQKTETKAKYRQGLRAAADRVAVLEELAGRGPLTEEQATELAELQPKVAQQKQQKKEENARYRQARRAEADRVVELEELAGQGPLTEEQKAELAELRPKVAGRGPKAAGRGRKKKDRGVVETGVGEAPVVGRDERIAGPEGVSEWTGTDQDGGDAWLADFDLGAWLELSVAGSAVSGDAGAGGAGVMLGEGAVEDVLVTGLPAFLGPDAGADDFAGFLPDYHDWEGSVGLFGAEGPDDGPFGDPSPEGAVWPDGVWPGVVGSGFRFVRGVNQASYFFGDARFRVNCLEACVAFHNSVKFGRQFVAGPAGDRDPARLEVAFGGRPGRWRVLLGLSGMCVAGRWGWLCRCCTSDPTAVRM